MPTIIREDVRGARSNAVAGNKTYLQNIARTEFYFMAFVSPVSCKPSFQVIRTDAKSPQRRYAELVQLFWLSDGRATRVR